MDGRSPDSTIAVMCTARSAPTADRNPTICDDVPGAPPAPTSYNALGSSRPSRWRFIVPLALGLLVVLAFMPALDSGLVDWDDDDLLVHNTRYRTLDSENLQWMFTTSYAGHFQPLTWLSYTLDWTLWQREWFGYHFTSVMLHALAAVAFYAVMRRLLIASRGNSADRLSARVVVSALFAAALFAVHPLRVESVAWLAERRDVLAGSLYVLAVACYLRYAGKRTSADYFAPVTTGFAWYAAALVLCALSLLAKASAITLPVVLLILDRYPLRRKGARIWVEKAPFALLALAAGVRALIAQDEGGALYALEQHGVIARLAQAAYGLVFYLHKTLWPGNLGPLYEIPPRAVLLGPMLWVNVTIVAAIVVVAVRLRRSVPAVTTALAVYLVVVFPVLGFAQSGPQLVADRYSYLSCMGFAALGGAGMLQLLKADGATRRRGRRALIALASVVIIVVFSRMTYRQSDIWMTPKTLWAHGIRISPDSAIAHTNYADALLLYGEPLPIVEHYYERALELNPIDAVALHHYADLNRRAGRLDQAIHYYVRCLRVDPGRTDACFNLARLLIAQGRARDAVATLRDGARRDPDALDLIAYLAQMLSTHPDEQIRDGEEAVKWATHVSRAQRDANPQALMTLATALAEAGRFEEAVATAQKALPLAQQEYDYSLAAALGRRLELFREHKPYHTD